MPSAAADPERPTVAFLIDRWDPARGGAERAMSALARALVERGQRVLAVAEQHAAGAPGEPVRVRSFGLTRSGRERSRARALVRAARESGAQVTIGCRHLYECDLYWPHGGAHAATLAQRSLARGEVPGKPSGRHAQFIAFERALVEGGGARRIVCVSELVRDEFARLFPSSAERLVVVENGVDLARFSPARRSSDGARVRARLGASPATPVIAFVGRNPELKGLTTLLAALARLADEGERDWLVAATDGDCGGADERVRERWRSVPEADVAELLAGADLLAHPTWRDTSGLVILEALASGVPVVTTRAAGAARRVSGAAGVVLPSPGDVEALAAALRAQLERVRSGRIDRDQVRACVADAALERCHAELLRHVLDLARTPRAASL